MIFLSLESYFRIMIVTTQGIVLRSRKYSESSKLVTVYSRDFGKISLIAKGARQSKSKFGSTLDALSASTLTFYKRPNRDLHTLSQAETLQPLRAILDSYEKLTIAMEIIESISSTQTEEEANPEIFDLLLRALSVLNTSTEYTRNVVPAFLLRLAEFMGFMLNPHTCAETDEPVLPTTAEHIVFSYAYGAPFHSEAPTQQIGFSMRTRSLEFLQILDKIPLEVVPSLPIGDADFTQISDFLHQFFRFHIDKNIASRTQQFLRNSAL